MDEPFRLDLKWSSVAFHLLIWPILQERIGGELVHVEQITDDSFAKDFDMLSGIDAWHIRREFGIRGIASRVQLCDLSKYHKPFNTFTIRKTRDSGAKTEYIKRKFSIYSQNGWTYPHLTVHGYVTSKYDGELLSFAVAKTKNIIDEIDAGNCWVKRTGNAEFYCVKWIDSLCDLVWERQPE